jgi:2-dehydro-3-deoxyphosphogluconate aldolase / (4S)-4-hydroxy-2-oxoglutarate aldolase
MHPVLENIRSYGIVPVAVVHDPLDAVPLAGALVDAGLPCIEVTFRTGAAAASIASMVKAYPSMVVGAGTVLTVEQARQAADAGARFIVAPGFNRKVVDHCLASNLPVLPGVATPSDVEAALDAGLTEVKFFPAEAQGGVSFLKAISAPYGKMMFVPTGGITADNLLSYLRLPNVLACGGSWMVGADLVAGKKFDDIRRLTEAALATMFAFELRHVGINGTSEDDAQSNASQFAEIFSMPVKPGASSIFVGPGFEFTKRKFPGDHGHLAVATHFPFRAKAFLERRGYAFNPETASEKNGQLVSVYLRQEIGGFAIHLLQA